MPTTDLKKLQREIYQNKIDHGFNIEDVEKEFNLTEGELKEAREAYRRRKPDLGEELADVVIYLLGLAEILGLDLGEEISRKVAKNKKRRYRKISGVLVDVDKSTRR